MRYVIWDVESTGIPGKADTLNGLPYTPKGEIIQLSALVCDNDLDATRLISFYCNPTEEISDGATRVHKITNTAIKKLSEGKFLEDYIVDKYDDIFFSTGNVFIGHNVQFDMRMLNNNLLNFYNDPVNFGRRVTTLSGLDESKNYHFDTMRAAQNYLGLSKFPKLTECINLLNLKEIVDNTFDHIMRVAKLENTSSFHNANYDVIATWVLCRELRKYTG